VAGVAIMLTLQGQFSTTTAATRWARCGAFDMATTVASDAATYSDGTTQSFWARDSKRALRMGHPPALPSAMPRQTMVMASRRCCHL